MTNLSDFLDLAATFANERATLAGRHDKAHGDWRFAGGGTVSHWGADVLYRKKHDRRTVRIRMFLIRCCIMFDARRGERL